MSSTRHEPPHVVVIGGGIAGLSAAHELLATAPRGSRRVTMLEAQRSLGGKIRTTPFAGRAAIDEGADAFLLRVPWARELAESVGIGGRLVSPATGRAAVWWDGLQPIPSGLLLGLPTELGALARSRLLSWRAKARAATELLRPRTSIEADSIGAWVRSRFGDEVHERLVDPLVGSIYAADTDRFSLASVPQLADLANGPRSVLIGARHRSTSTEGPIFASPVGGMAQLVDAVAARVTELGGEVRTDAPCQTLERDGVGWRIDGVHADAVVLACPAAQAARLLPAPAARPLLASIDYADVVLFTVALPRGDVPERLNGLSGYLVPKPVQQLVTAVSFGSRKWAHWDVLPSGEQADTVLMRISLGRDGLPLMHLSDERLLDAALTETGHHLGMTLRPTETRMSTWHRGFPQYRPHHHALVAAIVDELPTSVALAGASYHGIGIPACIRSGVEAARAIGLHVGPNAPSGSLTT